MCGCWKYIMTRDLADRFEQVVSLEKQAVRAEAAKWNSEYSSITMWCKYEYVYLTSLCLSVSLSHLQPFQPFHDNKEERCIFINKSVIVFHFVITEIQQKFSNDIMILKSSQFLATPYWNLPPGGSYNISSAFLIKIFLEKYCFFSNCGHYEMIYADVHMMVGVSVGFESVPACSRVKWGLVEYVLSEE